MLRMRTFVDEWPVRRPFKIAYHTFHHRDLLRVELSDGTHIGRGEAGGHPHLEPIADARARLHALRTGDRTRHDAPRNARRDTAGSGAQRFGLRHVGSRGQTGR